MATAAVRHCSNRPPGLLAAIISSTTLDPPVSVPPAPPAPPVRHLGRVRHLASAQVRISPPPLRTADGHHRDERHASWLELFFDLVFAGAVGQLAGALQDHLRLGTLARFVLLFIPVWWLWVQFRVLRRPARVRGSCAPGGVPDRHPAVRGPGGQRPAGPGRGHHRLRHRLRQSARPAAAAVRQSSVHAAGHPRAVWPLPGLLRRRWRAVAGFAGRAWPGPVRRLGRRAGLRRGRCAGHAGPLPAAPGQPHPPGRPVPAVRADRAGRIGGPADQRGHRAALERAAGRHPGRGPAHPGWPVVGLAHRRRPGRAEDMPGHRPVHHAEPAYRGRHRRSAAPACTSPSWPPTAAAPSASGPAPPSTAGSAST